MFYDKSAEDLKKVQMFEIFSCGGDRSRVLVAQATGANHTDIGTCT